MNLFKPSKLAVVIPTFLVGAVAGGAITHYAIDKPEVTNFSQAETVSPAGPNVDSSGSANQKGVLSPSEVALNISKYLNKEVKIKGFVSKTDSGMYNIAGQDPSKPFVVQLDFSQSNIDPSKYISIASEAKTIKQRTVTGKLVEVKGSNNASTFKLEVKEIQ